MTDAPAAPSVTPAPTPAVTPAFNVDELHKEIDAANKKLVSEEVSQIIAREKEAARKEAEKEFLVNQKLKDKEQEIEAMKKAQLEKERQASEQLEMLKRRLDELASTKQPVAIQNPFAGQPSSQHATQSHSILDLPESSLDEVEKASFSALLERKRAE